MNPRTIATFGVPPLAIAAIAATYSSSIALVWAGRSTILVLAVAFMCLGLKVVRAARVAPSSPAPFRSFRLRSAAWLRDGSSKPSALFLLILGVLPLSLYPVVFLFGFFDVLGVAQRGSFIDKVALGIVLFPAVTYPLVHLLFAVLTFRRLRKNDPAVRVSLVPVIYMAAAGVLMALARVFG